MKFLLLLFLVFLILLFAFGFSIIRLFFRLFFGGWNGGERQQSSKRQQDKANDMGAKHKSPKVISKDEGEYIDYEEVQ